ncbi:MAG: single-stranded-DNA-specific exonuclease RecJ [Deltaproteobacteria bacterium]|nr:single-stranded-DNA-specific exonuclease RecJ [Deltaproteobacteria bacterium]
MADPEAARAFLNPSLSRLPDPLGLPDMAAAVDRLVRAAVSRETVWVYTDYDVDGVTSAALLSDFFRESRIACRVRLPRRDREGYGLSSDALREIRAEGGTLVLTADCGISSVAEARLAHLLGVDLIITDHHTPGSELPDAVAVVNPKLPGGSYPDPMIAGVGVAWNLVSALRRRLREEGYYAAGPEPDVRRLLDLVALGTTCDVAPLVSVNRVFVAYGLQRLNGPEARPGTRALRDVAGLKGELRASHLGYQLGPRLNAAGRMAGPEQALELLLAREPESARGLASGLDALNRQRQEEERAVFASAAERVVREGWHPTRWSLVVDGENWHDGIIGIIASRLVEAYYRPTVVLTRAKGKGSARSIPGLNLYDVLGECSDHLERFGGHAAAAGLKLSVERIGPFREALETVVRRRLCEEDLRPVLHLDAEARLADLSVEAVGELSALEPFGVANPTPVLLLRRAGLLDLRTIGREGEHLKFRVEHGGRRVDALAWRKAEAWSSFRPGACVDLACTPQLSHWNGQTRVQLVLEGMRPAA